MSNIIKVIAKFHVLSTEEGGKRKTGIKSGYRPNHVFELLENKPFHTFIGEITFNDVEFIYPGEEKTVTVRFLRSDTMEKYIHVQRTWFVYEDPNLIAEAEILQLL